MFLCALLGLAGCQTTQTTDPEESLVGTTWQLQYMEGYDLERIEGLERPTLLLDSQTRRAGGSSGVNRYSMGYILEGTSLRFEQGASTRMAGPPEAMDFEQAFLDSLQTVTSWSLQDGTLVLSSEGIPALRFQKE